MNKIRNTEWFIKRLQPDEGGFGYHRVCGEMELMVCPNCNKETKNVFEMYHNISGETSHLFHCGECGKSRAGMFWQVKYGKIVYE